MDRIVRVERWNALGLRHEMMCLMELKGGKKKQKKKVRGVL